MSSNDPFDGPGTTSGVVWNDMQGRLLLITPLSEETINTAFGESKAIRADVVVLDAPEGVETYDDTLIFPRVLAGQVRHNIGSGRKNLGRLGQGMKKPGQNAPWVLTDPTEADKTIARNYLAKQTAAPF